MKIGLSFGRCVRDIVLGHVDYSDVLVIVARTHMRTEDDVRGVVSAYMGRREYLGGLDQDECEGVALALYASGKLFQPRLEGHRPGAAVDENYVWMDAVPTARENNEVVDKAWKGYQMALRLSHQEALPDQVKATRIPTIND